jgi:hypothetical protein
MSMKGLKTEVLVFVQQLREARYNRVSRYGLEQNAQARAARQWARKRGLAEIRGNDWCLTDKGKTIEENAVNVEADKEEGRHAPAS